MRDITLYYYNRQRFFRLVGLACASQFVFWSWMAYFQLSKLHFADLLNRESKKTQEKILDVSSKPGVSWKIVRFLEVREPILVFYCFLFTNTMFALWPWDTPPHSYTHHIVVISYLNLPLDFRVAYVPVKLKLQLPPWGIPRAFDSLSCSGAGHLITTHNGWGI